ncbi:DUF3298 domain-containing protein [Pseudodesulfovibrio sp. JC047]|uniref:DUF3298 and DUF4163 domain-containing protein n=1 Tax=Pseudodesulfovibrio sp. JC047 TaxID=2683199 RepID=UPI0013D4358A|nr:DUF3298 and DUF4163 domain-containing protein [Pseudodesulfovibrio sp. JC047]NDV19527.1 DUF3298 domain-containing protein [Pseudodesulfovibrio sp. JC047]
MNAIRLVSITVALLLFWPAQLCAESPCAPQVLSKIHIAEETAGFVVDATYPVLCAPNANAVIRDWVANRLFDFKKIDPGHDLSIFPHKYELAMDSSVWPAASRRFTSVKLDISVYTGGAHANHWPKTWIFDLVDGHQLTLNDLFTDPESALPNIAKLCQATLISSLGPENQPTILAGTAPKPENYKHFILTPEGLVFFFPPYQVASFADGEQIVTIPYSLLTEDLAPSLLQQLELDSSLSEDSPTV